MLKLAAVFENAAGKNHSWSFNDPDPNKSPESIKEALEAMTTIHLFEKDGIRQFCKVVSAKFVETIETPLFDLSKPAPEAYVADPNNIFAAHIISEEEAPQVSEMPETPVVEAAKQEKVVMEEVAVKKEETAPTAVKAAVSATEALKSIEKKPVAASSSLKAPAAKPESLAAVVEQAKNSSIIPSTSAQQLEAVAAESESSKSDSLPLQKPISSRKAQVDRVRAYHEANKKKKKGKKKKR